LSGAGAFARQPIVSQTRKQGDIEPQHNSTA
jgi:hypothetical protein